MYMPSIELGSERYHAAPRREIQKLSQKTLGCVLISWMKIKISRWPLRIVKISINCSTFSRLSFTHVVSPRNLHFNFNFAWFFELEINFREKSEKLCFLIKNAKKLIIWNLMNGIIGECNAGCVMGGKVVSKAVRMGNRARSTRIKCAAAIVSAARTNRCWQSRNHVWNLSPTPNFRGLSHSKWR